MFYYLDGTLAEREAGLAVIDCGGVGYGLTVSLTTSDALSSKVGARVKLYTYLQVKEDGMELFGFRDKDELDCFRLLIGVSGVGPKAAMAVLSIFTPDRFRLAVCTEDTKALAKAPNVGAKTAARIVLELKDKIAGLTLRTPATGGSTAGTAPVTGGKLGDAIEALMTLGYDRASAMNALSGLDAEKLSLNDLISQALRKFL